MPEWAWVHARDHFYYLLGIPPEHSKLSALWSSEKLKIKCCPGPKAPDTGVRRCGFKPRRAWLQGLKPFTALLWASGFLSVNGESRKAPCPEAQSTSWQETDIRGFGGRNLGGGSTLSSGQMGWEASGGGGVPTTTPELRGMEGLRGPKARERGAGRPHTEGLQPWKLGTRSWDPGGERGRNTHSWYQSSYSPGSHL